MSEISAVDEHHQTTQETVEKLLAERQEMLVLFRQVSGLDPDVAGVDGEEYLQEFCQVLVDYCAMGHFEILQRITQSEEAPACAREAAEKAYPALSETTSTIVSFNDKYENATSIDHAGLEKDLSRLGEVMAMRIELEDKLIECLLG